MSKRTKTSLTVALVLIFIALAGLLTWLVRRTPERPSPVSLKAAVYNVMVPDTGFATAKVPGGFEARDLRATRGEVRDVILERAKATEVTAVAAYKLYAVGVDVAGKAEPECSLYRSGQYIFGVVDGQLRLLSTDGKPPDRFDKDRAVFLK